jgi:ubiquinone/menaquinone biosynthesis C-methylase UbiE
MSQDQTDIVARQYNDFQVTLEKLDKKEKYLNYGYSASKDETYEEKQKRLCIEVFNAADIAPDDTIVDVGFGSGEQDILLANSYRFKKLIGFNIAEKQVDYANTRAKNLGLHKKISFRHGRAEELAGIRNNSVEKVIAVECAFYFQRNKFYQEAARVLKKGGLLVLADITFSDRLKWITRMGEDAYRVGYITKNRCEWERYFRTESVRDIRKHARPGAQMTVFQILKNMRHGFSKEKNLMGERKTWLKMALSTQLVALGLLTNLIRYDIIVLKKT